MYVFQLILMVLAFVLFLLATFSVASTRFSLGWGGLACWVLSQLLGMVR